MGLEARNWTSSHQWYLLLQALRDSIWACLPSVWWLLALTGVLSLLTPLAGLCLSDHMAFSTTFICVFSSVIGCRAHLGSQDPYLHRMCHDPLHK